MCVFDSNFNVIFDKAERSNYRFIIILDETMPRRDKYKWDFYYISGNIVYYLIDDGTCYNPEEGNGKRPKGTEYKATFKNNKVTIEELGTYELNAEGECV